MNEKPEALRLAERLVGMEASSNDQYQAAAELRRLHADNERLREALKTYGQHRNNCAAVLGGYQCTCGFNQQEQTR
jgi:hypothetical protein